MKTFSEEQFESILKKSQKGLKKYLRSQYQDYTYADGYLYVKGTAPVMVIAHLDTVHKQLVKTVYKRYGIWTSPEGIGGDDRCGVYLAMLLHENTGCHVLFTEDEEIGTIGARKYVARKKFPDVNYLIEIDRRGTNDAVYYDCANYEFEEFVSEFGYVTDYGSFSDISVIAPVMGVAAVNLSACYDNEHTKHESIDIYAMQRDIIRISEMIEEETALFEYVEAPKASAYYGDWNAKAWHGSYAGSYNHMDKTDSTAKTAKPRRKNYDDYFCFECEYAFECQVLDSYDSACLRFEQLSEDDNMVWSHVG